MHDIKCPHCDKTFKIDEAGYAEILKQVRDEAFDRDLHERLELAEQEKKTAIELAEAKAAGASKDDLAKRDAEIERLKTLLENADVAGELKLKEALGDVEKERDDLKRDLASRDAEHKLLEKSLREKYEVQIKDRDDAIERLKDMKAKLSTKMVGESLEQHCETEFNKIRAAAFPNAEFRKDNDASAGTKGDFIFRESDESDTEFVSIMFEMKNELDEGSNKKKNEDFLKKLDEDRNKKNCEYAVLVSMLEPDSELYNGGIVDVSHLYPRMYVVRPQFFIPIITLIRNEAHKTLKLRSELELVKAQNVDITTFEADLETFKTGFARNYDLASRQFEDSIAHIDRSIKSLEKTKDDLMRSANNLRLANNKLQDVSVKKLTRGNPTMADKFKELEASQLEAGQLVSGTEAGEANGHDPD